MNTPIKIYYHILAANHYLDIIREQLGCVKESGLYDECESISIGFLGNKEELNKAQQIFIQYPKIKFILQADNALLYEFHTMRILKQDCDKAKEKFYAVYIHTKGVSYTEEVYVRAGKVWRDYMMHWIVKEWRGWYKAFDMRFIGYDICGVKVIPARVSPSNRTHASGTMMAANSEYVRSLKPIDSLNLKDKFEAEMYLFSGQPIIYMPCNLFIDYLNRQPSYDEFVNNYPEYKDHCLL